MNESIKNPLSNIVILLVRTKNPGNIGAVARAMQNMGLRQLKLVSPRCSINEESFRMARSGQRILSGVRVHQSLRAALRGIRLTVGTTAKTGGYRAHVQAPRSIVGRILGHAARQKVALIFGPEDTGLIDADLLLCQWLVRIPTRPHANSINLAHAVMILCYELHFGHLDLEPLLVARLAPIEKVESMFEHLRKALLEIGFLQAQNTHHMMFRLRRLLGRANLEETDVDILRGIARQISWYSRAGKPEK